MTTEDETKPKRKRPTPNDPEGPALRAYEGRMFEQLGSPCTISRKGQRGSIRIEFFSNEELERVMEGMGISSQL